MSSRCGSGWNPKLLSGAEVAVEAQAECEIGMIGLVSPRMDVGIGRQSERAFAVRKLCSETDRHRTPALPKRPFEERKAALIGHQKKRTALT